MRFVLDASAVGAWLLADEDHPEARAILRSLSADSATAPLHWWFEVRNVLLMGERRGRTSEEQTAIFLDRLARLPIQLASLPNQNDLMKLARRHGLTLYDAAYLELAQRQGIAMATFDRRLGAAARAEGIALVFGPA